MKLLQLWSIKRPVKTCKTWGEEVVGGGGWGSYVLKARFGMKKDLQPAHKHPQIPDLQTYWEAGNEPVWDPGAQEPTQPSLRLSIQAGGGAQTPKG